MTTKKSIKNKKIDLPTEEMDEWGDIGYKTIMDFRDINGKGVDIRELMKALEKVINTRKKSKKQ